MIGMVEIELSEGLKDKIKIVLANARSFERKALSWELHENYRTKLFKLNRGVKNQPFCIGNFGFKDNKYYLLEDIMTMARTGGKVMLSPEGVRIINEVQALPNNEVYGMEY